MIRIRFCENLFGCLINFCVFLAAGSFKQFVFARSGVGNCLQTLLKLLLPGMGVLSSLVILGFGRLAANLPVSIC